MDGAAFEGKSEEEIKALKREYAIRQRIAEAERRREEDQERQRLELAAAREAKEEAERQKALQQFIQGSAKARQRAEKKANNERLNKKRDKKIEIREEKWKQRAKAQVLEIVKDHEEEEVRLEKALNRARQRKHAKEERRRQANIEKKVKDSLTEVKREEKWAERALAVEVRELNRCAQIKEDCENETNMFMHTPMMVPLKQVLAKSLRPVPGVSELLAVHKDTREELQDLQEADIPMQALLRKKMLFAYVREIIQEAEGKKVPVPQPSDMTKKQGGAGSRSPKGGTGKAKSTSPKRGKK
eukprot:gnl/TRDRNA2_/TRDRNA2_179227_c0_seq1.p1 gnl/TRDRNA2_/TRDRNA2_179227_c0~~gnl/TRDRNA2_/TRDRNA2_179227_c0_seq1.p1  ORF type:complete len:335 (-),score=110.71 gnl/TRDRNA2_/TRDRNA2_179227_c0_seq1:105-1004(-)